MLQMTYIEPKLISEYFDNLQQMINTKNKTKIKFANEKLLLILPFGGNSYIFIIDIQLIEKNKQ